MKRPTPQDGMPCRFSHEYVNRGKPHIRELRALARGTIAGRDDYGNWLVRWEGVPQEIAWAPACIQIDTETEDETAPPEAAPPAESNAYFDAGILSRATMDEAAADDFRRYATQVVLRDPDTDARVVCYRHPDGRVLLDAIRLPE